MKQSRQDFVSQLTAYSTRYGQEASEQVLGAFVEVLRWLERYDHSVVTLPAVAHRVGREIDCRALLPLVSGASFTPQLTAYSTRYGQEASEQVLGAFVEVLRWLERYGHGAVTLSTVEHRLDKRLDCRTLISL